MENQRYQPSEDRFPGITYDDNTALVIGIRATYDWLSNAIPNAAREFRKIMKFNKRFNPLA